VTGGYWVLLLGVGVGTMVTTATYIFFQWRQYEIGAHLRGLLVVAVDIPLLLLLLLRKAE
jgi:uncharacterized protein HemY